MAMSHKVFEGTAIAKNYALYRPPIPDYVTDTVINHCQLKNNTDGHPTLVVDVGCGSGQFTRTVARHFDRAVGCDISGAQIAEAKRLNQCCKAEYCISPAEELPVEINSVDLLTAASAAHWFKYPEFFHEADRVLRPGGCVVVLGTFRKTIHHEDSLMEKRIKECRDKYMIVLNEYRVIDEQTLLTFYQKLEFPTYEMQRNAVGVEKTFTANDYVNYVKTLSFSIKYMERHPNSTLFNEYHDSLLSILSSGSGDEADIRPCFHLTWWYDIIIARKPASTI